VNLRRASEPDLFRPHFFEELRKHGYDDQFVQRWLELQIEGIRCLISEIEASGGGRNGNTQTEGDRGQYRQAAKAAAQKG